MLNKYGRTRNVIINPPTKNPITAINEGNCRLLSPLIAWPEVHPPAYLVPNPIRNPPTTMKMKPFSVNNEDQLKIDKGASSFDSAAIP